jgi:hypothetical protein
MTRDYTSEVVRTRQQVRERRDEIVRALEQQLPEAAIIACLVDAIVQQDATIEVRLEFAVGIHQEVQAIVQEWQSLDRSVPGWTSGRSQETA